MVNDSNTIAAISTPLATGGLGIIRISGDDAIKIAAKVFVPYGTKEVESMTGYSAAYGTVYLSEKAIDQAILLVFRAPHSYTGENIAEISCHGGIYILNQVFRATIDAGAVPAAPGEFTKRAVLHGKIDLTQAEAVGNLIAAQGEQSANAAFTALEGALHNKIKAVADILIADSAALSAWVDYPYDEIAEISVDKLNGDIKSVLETLRDLLLNFNSGRAVTQGVDTCIVGKPNVGKSTLMNLLAGADRSIVTHHEGTTRDIVEETVNLKGLTLHLADTAGIRSTDDEIERIGVDIAKKRLERSQLILAVFDGSGIANKHDNDIIELCSGKKAIAVLNKADIGISFDTDLSQVFEQTVQMSAATGAGLNDLYEAIKKVLEIGEINTSAAMLANERQRLCCVHACSCLEEAVEALNIGLTLDAVNVSLDAAIDNLLTLTGERASEAVVEEIFSRFCVGK